MFVSIIILYKKKFYLFIYNKLNDVDYEFKKNIFKCFFIIDDYKH